MYRLRFAPSPTGELHIGNVRAALFNFLFARKMKGNLVLRIEDTDLDRSREEWIEKLIKDLTWLGIEFDEGPHKGGDFGPYRQTQRIELYQKYAFQLLEKGLAEKDFPENTKDNSDHFAIRFRAEGRVVEFEDLVFGRIKKEVEDFIILRSNGLPTYHLAVVVDDALMKISHVIRGQDHLGNTAKHVLLSEALGWESPVYAHYSLTYGLSKREESQSIRFFREKGYLPEAIVNAALLLGWSSKKQETEKFSIEDVIEEFDPNELTRVNAHFDAEKFEWLAGQYIRSASLDRLLELAEPFFRAKNWLSFSEEYRKQVLSLTLEKAHSVSEAVAQAEFFFAAPKNSLPETPFDISQSIRVLESFKLKLESGFLKETKEEKKEQDSKNISKLHPSKFQAPEQIAPQSSIELFNEPFKEKFRKLLKEIQMETGSKGKALFFPIRWTLSRKLHGPELFAIASVMGEAVVLERVQNFLEYLKKQK